MSRRAPPMSYMICRSAGSPATARSSQSREGARLVDVAADHQRVEGQAGVAHPAEAIVPVAHAADLLGQRRRRRRDDAAGRRVGQRLQREQRAHDGVAPRPLVGAAAGPLAPEALGRAPAPASASSAPAPARATGSQVSCERDALALRDVEQLRRHGRRRARGAPAPRRTSASGPAMKRSAVRVARRSRARPCRSRSGRRASSRSGPRPPGPRRCGPRRSARSPRRGMKSMMRTAPPSQTNSVSRISVSPR